MWLSHVPSVPMSKKNQIYYCLLPTGWLQAATAAAAAAAQAQDAHKGTGLLHVCLTRVLQIIEAVSSARYRNVAYSGYTALQGFKFEQNWTQQCAKPYTHLQIEWM